MSQTVRRRRKRKRKGKCRKVSAFDVRKGKWVKTNTKNPNCRFEDGIFVVRLK